MSADIQDVLLDLGLVLNDRGNEWRTSAVWRGGNNDTALVIYKDNGSFRDFGSGIQGSLKDLIKLVLGFDKKEDVESYLNSLKYEEAEVSLRKPTLKMPSTFNPQAVQNLLPHYAFFHKRGISTNTLSVFGGGVAGEGQMLRRYVFPIWDEHKKAVHGYSGRDLMDRSVSTRIKWKLLGLKRYWVYPLFANREIIQAKREIILVESIGDMLALWEAGYPQTLCSFGIELPAYFALFNRIISLNPKRILLGFNNDADSAQNNGQLAAIKIRESLCGVFDPRQIVNAPPLRNDFGAMITPETGTDLIHEWYQKYEQAA